MSINFVAVVTNIEEKFLIITVVGIAVLIIRDFLTAIVANAENGLKKTMRHLTKNQSRTTFSNQINDVFPVAERSVWFETKNDNSGFTNTNTAVAINNNTFSAMLQ